MVKTLNLAHISRFVRQATISCLLMYLATVTTAHGFSVTVDRQVVPMNETIRLEITSLNGDSPDNIDLNVLEEAFTVIKESSRNSISIFNGKTESVKKRVVIITPREVGKVLIPELQLKKERSQAISITVIKAAPVPSQMDNNKVMLESEINQTTTIVGAQAIYTLKIIYQIQLNNADISPLSIADADIVPLDNKNYTRQINGSNFYVTEKRYAVFFNRPGKKIIDGQQLTALTTSRQSRLFGYDPFSRGKELRLKAQPVEINVLVKPNAGQSSPYWLPSSDLSIVSSFNNTPMVVRVGEPLSRTVEITAVGLAAERLPFTLSIATDTINSYAEKPEFVNQTFEHGVAGRRKDTIALIPTVEGLITLPSIELQWWNTKENRFELATVEQQIINVLPAKDSVSTGNNSIPSANDPYQKSSVPIHDVTNAIDDPINPWMISSLMLTVAWLLTYYLLSNKESHQPPPPDANIKENINQLKINLLKACQKNNAAEAKQALNVFLSNYNDTVRSSIYSDKVTDPSLASLASADQGELNNAIERLDYYLYAHRSDESEKSSRVPWDGKPLKMAIEHFVKEEKSVPHRKETLAPLYPK